jgi:hypothetical protein
LLVLLFGRFFEHIKNRSPSFMYTAYSGKSLFVPDRLRLMEHCTTPALLGQAVVRNLRMSLRSKADASNSGADGVSEAGEGPLSSSYSSGSGDGLRSFFRLRVFFSSRGSRGSGEPRGGESSERRRGGES